MIVEETLKMNDIIEKTAQAVVSEIKNKGMLREKKTPYQKTETLLYNYLSFKAAIKDKESQIETIRKEGAPKRSKSITVVSNNMTFDNKSESERAEELIHGIRRSMQRTLGFVEMIEEALAMCQNDPYYRIISLHYFEGATREDIADQLFCDVKTVTRNKKRLINMMRVRLFSDECLDEMFE